MGLFEKLFNPKQQSNMKQVDGFFKTLTAYSPSFTTFEGGVYEMEITRAAIDRYATFCSKLKPEIQGNAYKNLEKVLQFKPNPWQTTSQFLYRLATILKVNTTAFILPLYEDDYETIRGFYPLLPTQTEIIQVDGEPWLRYRFANGERAAIELSRVGILTRYQYKNDFFGDGNSALNPTLQLLDIQKQGIMDGIKQSATLRIIARLSGVLNPTDMEKERKAFSKANLSMENDSGVMLFDNKYADIKQIDSKPIFLDDKQMQLINNNVYNYFGTNEAILQNKFSEEEFNAYYEAEIETFGLQLALVLTNMLFTNKEIAYGNSVIFTANRLQYASNNTKLQVSSQLFDRGILTRNQVMDIWNLAHVPDGDKVYIRREYAEIDKLNEEGVKLDAIGKEQGVQTTTNSDTTNKQEEDR